MNPNQNKIKLSPRLKMGVGRAGNGYSFFKIGGFILIFLSIALTIRAGYMIFRPSEEAAENPQVLGAQDNSNQAKEELYTTYNVNSGDTLFTISKEYGIEWTVLASLNNLQPPFSLQIGEKLKIPKN